MIRIEVTKFALFTDVTVRGNTFAHKDALRELGLRWCGDTRSWFLTARTDEQVEAVRAYVEGARAEKKKAPKAEKPVVTSAPNVTEDELEKFERCKIYEMNSYDYRTIFEYAHNGSNWFRRHKENGRMKAWECSGGPSRPAYGGKFNCRLPASA